jgi:hypothetical protein
MAGTGLICGEAPYPSPRTVAHTLVFSDKREYNKGGQPAGELQQQFAWELRMCRSHSVEHIEGKVSHETDIATE